jgi:hypothetical protein
MSSLHSCGHLAYSDNERVKQLLYALDDLVWYENHCFGGIC